MNGDIVAVQLLDRSLYRVYQRDLEEYLSQKGTPMTLPEHRPAPRPNTGENCFYKPTKVFFSG